MLTEPHGVTWRDLGLVELYLERSCISGVDVNVWEGCLVEVLPLIFFPRHKVDDIKAMNLHKCPQRKQNYNQVQKDPDGQTPWLGYSPSTAAKSPHIGPGEPSPCNIVVVMWLKIIDSIFIFNVRINHQSRPGKRMMRSTNPRKLEIGEDACSTTKLRGASPLKGRAPSPKHHAERTATSTAPSTGDLEEPTLYTHRERPPPSDYRSDRRRER
jgi:hypothetical protein